MLFELVYCFHLIIKMISLLSYSYSNKLRPNKQSPPPSKTQLKLILSNDNVNLGDRATGKVPVGPVNFHRELELDVLRTLYALGHHQDRLRREGSTQSKSVLGGRLNSWWCVRPDEGQVEVNRGAGKVVSAPHGEQLDLAGDHRYRVHRNDAYVVEGVVSRTLEARLVVRVTEWIFSHATTVIMKKFKS